MSFNDLEQKTKGIVQQVKGEIETRTGRPIKGAFDKMKGKANETIADIKMKAKSKDKAAM
ncbi:MAG: hypothetical protein RI947_1470 [Candidatus Parcubacteria bacterium]|jgi:uncharacterized protein YjbJ (UPF0337 family)